MSRPEVIASGERPQAGPVLSIGAQAQAEAKDAHGKKEGIGFGFSDRNLDAEHDDKGQPHEDPLKPVELNSSLLIRSS